MSVGGFPLRPRRRIAEQRPPQEQIDDFWSRFTTKTPGKATSVIPQRAGRSRAARGSQPGGTSYEEAAAQCRAKVAHIVKECRRVNQRYYDPHFDLERDLHSGIDDCLQGLHNIYRLARPARIEDEEDDRRPRPGAVKRVTDIFDKPQFFIDGPTANDVRQGVSGDCWLMAALCTMGNKPGLIERVCVAQDEIVGVYGFVFHRDGEWFSEVIDDKLYLKQPDYDDALREREVFDEHVRINSEEEYRKLYQANSGALFFAQCENANETWLPLLEKAYAKAHGDYNAIDGGLTGEGIEDLTGGVTSEIYTTNILNKEHFWREEILRVNESFLFGCSTGLWNDGQGRRDGLIMRHAYSILRAVEMDGVRLVLLKNPWGHEEWKGRWGDGSREWTAEWMQKLNHRFGDDGAFWISYEDLLRKYQCFDRTRLFDASWHLASLWTTMTVPWMVEYNASKFAFRLTRAGPVVLVLSQLDNRYFRGLQGQYRFRLSFRLQKTDEDGRRDGQHDELDDRFDYVVRSQPGYRMERSTSVELDLDAGSYLVLVKVDATRNENVMPPEEVVRQTAKRQREKLTRIGLAYDLAHSKGRIVATAEEKKAHAAAMARRRDKDKMQLKQELLQDIRLNHMRRQHEHNVARRIRRRWEAKEARRKAREELMGPKIGKASAGEEGSIAAENTPTSSKQTLEENLGCDQADAPPPKSSCSPWWSADSQISESDVSELELEKIFLERPMRQRSPSPLSRRRAPFKPMAPGGDDDDNEKDPWNAVTVVGLRVYYQEVEGDSGDVVKMWVERPNPLLADDFEDSEPGEEEKGDGDKDQQEVTKEEVLDLDDSLKDASGLARTGQKAANLVDPSTLVKRLSILPSCFTAIASFPRPVDTCQGCVDCRLRFELDPLYILFSSLNPTGLSDDDDAVASCGAQCVPTVHHTFRRRVGRASGSIACGKQCEQLRRTFLGSLRRAPPRQLKEQQVEPGYDVLLQFRACTAEDTRRPAREELVQAFRDFFGYKYQYGKRVNATQAEWMLRLFEYLSDGLAAMEGDPLRGGLRRVRRNGRDTASVVDLTLEELRAAREALARQPGDTDETTTRHHLELCRRIYGEMQRRSAATAVDFKRHVAVLCQYGASLEAASLLSSYLTAAARSEGAAGASVQRSRRDKELWLVVLGGLAQEGREEALLREATAALAAGLEYMPAFHEIMTTFYARRNNLAQTRAWFDRPMARRLLLPTARTFRELLAFGKKPEGTKKEDKRDGRQKWIQTTFQQLCDANPPKDLWDVIFQWAVVLLDKGVDDVRHMMATMARHNAGRPDMEPDAATINGLVAAAARRGDVLLAERFVRLGADLGIAADGQTHVQQLDYRVTAGDLSGAHASFLALGDSSQDEAMGGQDEVDEAERAVNRYVRALTDKTTSVTQLRDVVDAVERRQIALEPTTVVALCMAFLRLDRQYDVIDVLSVHALQYSADDRAHVRDALVAYATNVATTSTARAWDAYSLLRQYFAETPSACRVRLMDAFFRRRRPDMAAMVFGHMRSATDPALRPTADMYVRCLEGLAACAGAGVGAGWGSGGGSAYSAAENADTTAPSLHMVHNMLKMDALVQPDTRLLNALMLAYAAAGSADDRARALDFWHDISRSAEGPSYASLVAVFYVCEGLPFGDAHARRIWARLMRMEIDVPPAVYDAYCGALAGQGHVDDVQRLIRGMVRSAGYGPTATTLAIAHNALPGQVLQHDFAQWAAQQYADLWQQTTQLGCRTTVDGLRRYNVTRELRA
ncbi:calpain-like protein [Grosmannia clavigera kw1407]|uniref:Calpain-like protein n=1 Tax=Grosmannia clavigera (strain kw1407 / UAMH 11150) TaxID=655863 RepID=F0XGL8_GROCL|nr:calpain-like protein [Grosmannia clavigera kw1407]EFX03067.1 calpain-like protein [Grosmannia clavigera kw1407]